jgi:hypothetical protein
MAKSNGWSPDRKERQSAAIRQWKPWERSTGPLTSKGKALSSRNAFKGGKRPKFRADLAFFRMMVRSLDTGR